MAKAAATAVENLHACDWYPFPVSEGCCRTAMMSIVSFPATPEGVMSVSSRAISIFCLWRQHQAVTQVEGSFSVKVLSGDA